MKVSTVQAKLGRIEEQIETAKVRIDAIDTELAAAEASLSQSLSKVNLDDESVDQLEIARDVLLDEKRRLEARVAALEGTIGPETTVLNRSRLREAVQDHAKAVGEVDKALQSWRTKAQAVSDLEAIGVAVLEKRTALAELTSEVAYLAELLGEPRPKLPTARHLRNDEPSAVKATLQRSFCQELDPWRHNKFDDKLKALNAEKEEAKRVVARAKHHKEALAAGW